MIREFRVRPVIRYIVQDYTDASGGGLSEVGEFANANLANRVAADACYAARVRDAQPHARIDPARQLRIEMIRGPSAPQVPTRYALREVTHA